MSGLVVGALSLRLVDERGIRSLFLVNAIATVTAGLLAVSVPGGLPFLLYLVSVWAAVTGFVELYAGLRARGRTPAARDWIAAGAFTAVGLLGAYLVILGVYLVIGGFSLKWAAAPGAATSGSEQHS